MVAGRSLEWCRKLYTGGKVSFDYGIARLESVGAGKTGSLSSPID